MKIVKTMKERFDEKWLPEPNSGCWLWTSEWKQGKNTFPYGKIRPGFKKPYKYAHRLSWELYVGKIPEGLNVCHKCDVPQCVNPQHLFLGTHADNSADKWRKGRAFPPPIHLGSKHPNSVLTEEKVIEIRKMYATGNFSQKEISRKLNVYYTHIHKIVHRQIWTHV